MVITLYIHTLFWFPHTHLRAYACVCVILFYFVGSFCTFRTHLVHIAAHTLPFLPFILFTAFVCVLLLCLCVRPCHAAHTHVVLPFLRICGYFVGSSLAPLPYHTTLCTFGSQNFLLRFPLRFPFCLVTLLRYLPTAVTHPLLRLYAAFPFNGMVVCPVPLPPLRCHTVASFKPYRCPLLCILHTPLPHTHLPAFICTYVPLPFKTCVLYYHGSSSLHTLYTHTTHPVIQWEPVTVEGGSGRDIPLPFQYIWFYMHSPSHPSPPHTPPPFPSPSPTHPHPTPPPLCPHPTHTYPHTG